jgi:hypothetical protein
VVNRRLQSLLGYFEGLSSATGLSLPWIGAESLQVSADVRQYCERLVSLAISDCRLAEYSIADVPSPIIHHVLLTVGTKMLCTHSAVQGHTLHPHDLAMISIRLAERQRSKTIANETEMIWLMKGDHNEHDGEESQRQCRRERYIMYIGRITPGVTAVILRYCASELSIEPLSPPSSLIDPQMLLDCSRLQAILQQSAQNTNEGDEILARSGLPSLEQLTEFLVCKDQSHVSMLPYWTMFPGLVYFISRDPRTGHTMMPTIDDNLYSGTSTGVERCACDQKQIQSLMFEWIRQSKDMSLHHDCLVVRNTTFSFAFCRTIPVDNNASNGLEISSSHGSHSLIWSIWLADIPVDSIRKFFFVFPKSF